MKYYMIDDWYRYIEGGNMQAFIGGGQHRAGGSGSFGIQMDEDRMIKYAKQIAQAMAYMHKQN
jgi:serine/threonine protein kinase